VSATIVDPRTIDHARLRDERQARLQASMRDHGVEMCLLFNEPNIRYATGVSTMPIWALTTMVRCALVPAEGTPILFEHPNSVHRARLLAKDVRPMGSWEFCDDADALADGWAGEISASGSRSWTRRPRPRRRARSRRPRRSGSSGRTARS
jgi:Xaa-Pro aminopeptidase